MGTVAVVKSVWHSNGVLILTHVMSLVVKSLVSELPHAVALTRVEWV